MRGMMEAGADSSVTQRGYRGVEAGTSDTSSTQGQGGQTSRLADCETGEEGDEALGMRRLSGLNVCCMFVFTCMMLCVGINVMTDPRRLLELFICIQLIIGLTFHLR